MESQAALTLLLRALRAGGRSLDALSHGDDGTSGLQGAGEVLIAVAGVSPSPTSTHTHPSHPTPPHPTPPHPTPSQPTLPTPCTLSTPPCPCTLPTPLSQAWRACCEVWGSGVQPAHLPQRHWTRQLRQLWQPRQHRAAPPPAVSSHRRAAAAAAAAAAAETAAAAARDLGGSAPASTSNRS